MTPPLVLRLAGPGDSELLLEWRNEPTTRMNSFDTAEIARADHERWLTERLASAETRIYIAEIDGRPVGQARVDRRGALVGVISVAVGEDSRGRGVGRALIAAASARAADELGVDRIEAAIKPSNESSLRAFRAAGYVDAADAAATVCTLSWSRPGTRQDQRPVTEGGRRAVTGSRLVRSTLVNALGTASGMIVTILLTPFMLERLGADAFGVWALAVTLTVSGYLTLTDLGLQQASVRFMSDARRDGDIRGLTAVFSSTLAVFLAVGALAATTVVVLAPALADLFGVHGELRHAAVVSFAIVGAQIVLDLPAFAFRAVLESDQRFVAIRVIDLGRSLVFACLTVVVLVLGRGVVAVAAASAAAAVAALAGYVAVVSSTEPAGRFRPSAVSRTQLRRLFGFGGSLFALRILSVIYRQMDKVIIGVALSVAAVATYEVANRIQAALFLIIGIGGSALLPAAVISRLDKTVMRDLFLRTTSYSVALFVPVCVAVFVYARLLIIAWIGESQTGATGSTRLFAIWAGLGAFDVAGTTMLVAIGRLKPILVLSTLWVAANLALSIALVHVWGITGVVAGTVITYMPLLVAYTVICLREFEIPASEWTRRVLLPNLPGPVVQIVVSVATLHELERLPPWSGVIVGFACSVTLSIAIYLMLGIRHAERRYLRQVVLRAAGRSPREAPG